MRIELEAWVMEQCAEFDGGAGFWAEHRISRIFAGTSGIMLEIIGRGLGLDERKMN